MRKQQEVPRFQIHTSTVNELNTTHRNRQTYCNPRIPGMFCHRRGCFILFLVVPYCFLMKKKKWIGACAAAFWLQFTRYCIIWEICLVCTRNMPLGMQFCKLSHMVSIWKAGYPNVLSNVLQFVDILRH